MKKFFVSGFFIFIFFVFNSNTALASSNYFGGKVVSTEASEILNAKESGYQCEIPGKTIQIKTKNGSEGYFLPQRLVPRLRRAIAVGQGVLGKKNDYVRIVCTKKTDEKTSRIIVTLKNISYFGN